MRNRPPELISLDVDPEHLAAVGKVATEWAVLETFLNMAIWQLADLGSEAGACLTAQIQTIVRRVDTIIALMRLKNADETFIKAIGRFYEKANKLSKERNRIVHDPWGTGIETGKTYRTEITAEKRLIFEHKQIETGTVLKTASDINKLRWEWITLCNCSPLMVRAA
jgi:hypothetical protein